MSDSDQPAPTREQLVYQTVGAASMCWEHPEAAGIFDTDAARDVADKLLAALDDRAQTAEAKLAIIRALHGPQGDGVGWLPDGDYGTITPACGCCGTPDEYAVPWPCRTVRIIDGLDAGGAHAD